MRRGLAFGVLSLVILSACAESATCPAVPAPAAAAAPSQGAAPPVSTVPTIALGPAPAAPGSLASNIELIKNALMADQSGDLEGCVRYDRAALANEENARTRLHLASCESRQGHLVAARADTAAALAAGEQSNDASVVKVARARLREIDNRTATVQAIFGAGASVALDDQLLTPNAKMIADPGAHTVTVTFGGGSREVKQLSLVEREDLAVDVDSAKKSVETRSNVRQPAAPLSRTGI